MMSVVNRCGKHVKKCVAIGILCFVAMTVKAGAWPMLFSTKDEIELGRKMQAQDEAAWGGRVENEAYRKRIARIMARLLPYTKRKDIPYSFTIVSGRVNGGTIVNACALPGGPMIFTVPLLNIMKPDTDVPESDADATLAFVAAHEISHVELRHSMKQLNDKIWELTLAGMIQKQTGTALVNTALQVGTQVIFAKHSQKDESAADEAGIRLMGKAGYNMALAVRALDRLGGGKYKGMQRYLQTHPSTPDRMERARQLVQWLREDPSRLRNDVKFKPSKEHHQSDSSPGKDKNKSAPPSSSSTQILDDDDSQTSNDANRDDSTPQSLTEIRFSSPLFLFNQGTYRIIMAPITDFARWAKAEVQVDGAKIILHRHRYQAQFTRDSNSASINGKSITMGAICKVYNGEYYVPIGNLASAIGATATYDASRNRVILSGAGEEGYVRLPK
jgi:predicted Zn-dependent protease